VTHVVLLLTLVLQTTTFILPIQQYSHVSNRATNLKMNLYACPTVQTSSHLHAQRLLQIHSLLRRNKCMCSSAAKQLTINLLRASNTNPSISAWEHVRGKFVFQDTPIAPPGTPVLVYESPRCPPQCPSPWQSYTRSCMISSPARLGGHPPVSCPSLT
jgi:hypothetical protein